MVGVLLLAGCGGGVKPSSTPSPAMTTYTDPTFHFSVNYGANVFRPEPGDRRGIVFFDLYLHGKYQGEVSVTVLRVDAWAASELRADWGIPGRAEYAPSMSPWNLYVPGASASRWVTLNGIRGKRVESKDGPDRATYCLLLHGNDTCTMVAGVSAKQWTTVAPLLYAVMTSFRFVN